MTKAEINARLTTPFTAAQLKKVKLDQLQSMLDTELNDRASEKAADAAHARIDEGETMIQQIERMTNLQKCVVVALLDAGMDCNGAETVDAMLGDNMTFSDVAELAKRTGLTKKQVTGVLPSLPEMISTDLEPTNGEGPVQQALTDWGVRTAFELCALGVEAKPVTTKKPVELQDLIITEAQVDLKMVKPVTDGSKRHLLAAALLRGATMEHLMETVGWDRSTTGSALRWDIGQMGLGCERKGGKYFLILPEGVKRIPVKQKTQTRADALVDACK